MIEFNAKSFLKRWKFLSFQNFVLHKVQMSLWKSLFSLIFTRFYGKNYKKLDFSTYFTRFYGKHYRIESPASPLVSSISTRFCYKHYRKPCVSIVSPIFIQIYGKNYRMQGVSTCFTNFHSIFYKNDRKCLHFFSQFTLKFTIKNYRKPGVSISLTKFH